MRGEYYLPNGGKPAEGKIKKSHPGVVFPRGELRAPGLKGNRRS